MECPFNIDLADNESDDDPEVDEDEHLMEVETENTLKPVEGFAVEQDHEPFSKFDKEQ